MAPSSKPTLPWKATLAAVTDDPSHPLQVALRTYSLCLSLVLGPVLLPAVFALVLRPKSFVSRARVFGHALSSELRLTGFASAIAVAAAGGAALQRLSDFLAHRHTPHSVHCHSINSKLSRCQISFLANIVSSTLAVTLLRWKRHRRLGATSSTLDLTLLLLVRALDASVQTFLLRKAREIAARDAWVSSRNDTALRSFVIPYTPPDTKSLDKQSEDLAEQWQGKVATRFDAFIFWASSARIMWCFFYQPRRLPPSFVKWIHSLANVDERLLKVLRAIREGTWSYIRGSSTKRDIAGSLAEQLGRPPSWGDPALLPAYGGDLASDAWKHLGVNGRSGIGGMPCELVHCGIGASFGFQNNCIANAAIRAMYAFAQALVLHLPVHFLPILLTSPSSVMHPRRTLTAFLSALRSAAFLSTFVSSYWFTVCLTRTLVLARLLPKVSHDIWDGPCGGTLAGSLVCGISIWVENVRRRREVALYVLSKALRASISEKWLRSNHPAVQFVESLTFILSSASLLTFSAHQPASLRGLSRWTLAFIMRGPNTSFWKMRRRVTATGPPTPTGPFIPPPTGSSDHVPQAIDVISATKTNPICDYPLQRCSAQS